MSGCKNSKVVCPKCKSNNLYLIEVWKNHTIQWDQENGVFDKNDGVLEMGEVSHLDGECKKCKHSWKIRGVLQIDEIIKN